MRELARVMQRHTNIIGFDLGNEVNTCWSAPAAMGDAWMTKMLAVMEREAPGTSECERRRSSSVVRWADVSRHARWRRSASR